MNDLKLLLKEELTKVKTGSEWDNGYKAAIEFALVAIGKQPKQNISCVCPNEIKTGTVSVHCCNICGKPDEDWWGKP